MPKDGRGPQPPNALAVEIASALFSAGWRDAQGRRNGQPRGGAPPPAGSRGKPEDGRQQQWYCTACGVPNDLSRQVCRRCSCARRPRSKPRAQQAPSAGRTSPKEWPQAAKGTTPSPKEPTPAGKATALEQAVATARAAGASGDAVASLAAEAAVARRNAAEGRPLGARLDSARAGLAKAERKAVAAEEAFSAATERRDAAAKEVQAARATVDELEAEVAQAQASSPPPSLQEFAASTRRLLLALESLPLTSPDAGQEVEPVLRAMAELHRVMGEAAAEPDAMAVPEAVASTTRGETTLDDLADVMFGDAEFADGSDEEESEADATEPLRGRLAAGNKGGGARGSAAELAEERHGSRTPPRARPTGKGASSGTSGR